MDDDLYRRITSGDYEAYLSLISQQAHRLAATLTIRADGSPWTEEDTDDLVGEFCASAGFQEALLSATNDDQLRAILYTALRNINRDQHRKTERGRLRRRLIEVLRDTDRFVEDPTGFWRLSDRPAGQVSSTRHADLVAVSWTVTPKVVVWRDDAARESPHTDGESWISLLLTVLGAADGAVDVSELADVCAKRFGLGPVSHLEELDLPDEREPPDPDAVAPDTAVVADDEELEAAVEAVVIWGQLSPGERQLLPLLLGSVRDAASETGIPKSTIQPAMARLKSKMQTLLEYAEPDRHAAIARELLVLAGADR